jgi:hypothetical protein
MITSTLSFSTGRALRKPSKLDVAQFKELGVVSSLAKHRRCHVDAGHAALSADHLRREKRVKASPGSEINDLFTRCEMTPGEGVADASKTLDNRIGQRLHTLCGVPQAVSEESTGVEVKPLPGTRRDLGVLVLDGGTELIQI